MCGVRKLHACGLGREGEERAHGNARGISRVRFTVAVGVLSTYRLVGVRKPSPQGPPLVVFGSVVDGREPFTSMVMHFLVFAACRFF